MGAALILYALGINEQTMMEDYLASNVYLSDKYAKEIAKSKICTHCQERVSASRTRPDQDNTR